MTDCEHEFHWHLADCNEDGWACACGFKPGDNGHSPQLDRELTGAKVGAILHHLHHHDFVYMSNGDMGEHVTAMATSAVESAGTYDQWSIVLEIMRLLCGDPNAPGGHASFWKRRDEAALAKDPPKGAA